MEIASATVVWYHTGMPPLPIRWILVHGPSRDRDPPPLLCTDQNCAGAQFVSWFILRWQIEVTSQEVRTHLGVETQRQWSDLATARTTPSLLALFSWITVAAHSKVVVDTLSLRILFGQHSPLDAAYYDVQDAVDHFPHIQAAGSSAKFRRWNKFLDNVPLTVGHVAWVVSLVHNDDSYHDLPDSYHFSNSLLQDQHRRILSSTSTIGYLWC